MRHGRSALLTTVLATVLAAGLSGLGGAPSAAEPPPPPPPVAGGPASPELPVTDRLAERRYVVSGTRGYAVGTQDGRYPAMGFHTTGEMGGIWSQPLKLLDGIWFAVDGTWLPPAERFTSGYGYTRMEFPPVKGVRVARTDVVPDGRRGLLVGLTLTGGTAAAPRSVALDVDAHSELMSAYPWATTTPGQASANLRDRVQVQDGRLVFTDRGTPPGPNQPRHDWAAVVGAASGSGLRLVGSRTGSAFRGPQDPARICPATGTAPPVCDDSAFGKGAGGRLRYTVAVPARGSATVWFAVAGSDRGLAGARAEFAATSAEPAKQVRAKVAHRRDLAARTVVSLPGNALLQQAMAWGKQNLADSVQQAGGRQGTPLLVRATNEGKRFPPAAGRVAQIGYYGAGFPDYPWLFATDGEYTAFAAVAVGQFDAVKAHLRALRDVSRVVNGRTGKVVHEVTPEGSVYFGATTDRGNTDETVKFPSAVALVWRWTGDNAFRDEMYDYAVSNLRYATTTLDADRDGWPEGAGNVERTGQGTEKLDNAVYLVRGMYDVAAMAESKGRTADARAWRDRAAALAERFERTWWFGGSNPGTPTPGSAASYADSITGSANARVYQRYWTGATPMEAELWMGGRAVPGLADPRHAVPALELRETECFTSGSGLVHTGSGATTAPNQPQPFPARNCPGDRATSDQPDERNSYTLNSAVMAVAEGNYGRLGKGQQQRYTDAVSRLMLTPDEMPGAMPEIAPSDPHPPYYGHSLGRRLTERAMVLQAWGNYATMWPVVHQQLGVSPDLGNGRLEVVPQVPGYATGPLTGTSIRLGSGSIAVTAAADGDRYTTTVDRRFRVRLTIGHVLPAGTEVISVTVNGSPATYQVRDTHRGREVLVAAPQRAAGGVDRLLVTTR